MATTLNFPSSPNTNDTYSFGGKTWTYNGTAWKLNSTALTTTGVTEGTNLYFTNARSRAAISVAGSGSYDSSTGVITVTGGVTSVNGQTGAATGFATTANSLSQFASTTSAQLATLISDETGTGSVVFSASPALTGTPTAPTAANATTSTQIATTAFVQYAVSNLVNAAPAALDTLNELATAIGNDNNFSTTIVTLVGNARNQANAAYDSSNVAYTAATASFAQANTATLASAAGFDKANTAYVAATAAFNSGNTKVATVAGVTSTTISNAQLASGISSSGILTTANVSELTNLYFTNARSRGAISVTGAGSYDSGTGVITITGGVSSVGGATGAVSNAQLASGITTSGVLNTSNVAEGANLYFTTSRARASIDAAFGGPITYSSTTGNVALSASGVTANTYGGSSKVPVFTVDTFGRITSASNVSVAGVSTFTASGNTFTIGTADGGSFSASIQPDSVTLGRDTTGAYVASMTAGNGITVGTATGEGSTPVITNTGVLSVNGQTGNATGFATTANSLAQFASTSSAQLRTLVSDETGSGSLVFSDSPVLITPNIGTASYAVLTNATGLPVSTGISGLGSGVATFLATPSSANLAAAVTDETGTGNILFSNSPVMVTPNLGTPSAVTLTNATGLPVATGISGLGTGVATFLATPSSSNFAAAITDETGTGNVVFSNSPVLVTPNIGTPSYLNLANATGLSINALTGFGANVTTFLATPTSQNLAFAVTDETGTGNLLFGNSPAITSSVTTPSASFDLVNTTATTVNFAGAGTTVNIGALTGNTNIRNNMVIAGNLLVQGTTTTVSSTTLDVADKNLTLAKGAGTSAGADGAGITIDGANATFNYVHATTAWTSSQDVDLATGKAVKIAGTNVLNATGLGPNVVNSNLTSVGTITTGVWNGTEIGTAYTAAKVTSVNGQVGAATGFATTANSLAQFASTTSAQLATLISDETGTGSLVFSANAVLTTPNLGTPSAATLTNATGLPVATGISGLGTGVATFLATPSSSNLSSALTDETGTGNVVFSTSPVLTTPNLGTPSTAVLTNATGLPISSGVSGLGANVATFLADPTSAKLAFAITDETGSGSLVFANSPTLVTPALGTPSSATLTNATGLPVSTGIAGLGANQTTLLAANAMSGVAATTYGSTLNIPVITVDVYGRITSASNVAITSGVSSVGGATGAVSNAQLASSITSSGVLTTANVAEVTNLYYTDTRARNALSAGTGISYNSGTGAISSTITQYTDTNARGALSINGSKGAYNNSTGVFDFANIANVTVSANAPGSPNVGDQWIDEDDGATYLYFNDGTSSQWVEQASGTIISGIITSVAGSTGAISNAMIATALTGQTLNVANLTVTGTLTSIQSTNLDITDKNITVAKGAANSAAADGAGITVDGANATFNYVHANTSWTSSQDIDLATGKAYEINGTSVLSGSTLGSGVTSSSLTSFGSSPTLVTPNLGTPSSVVLTNASGTASNLTANIANFINVTDDTTTNATRYLIVANGTSGTVTETVSSTKLTFNPSTGQLTATDLNSSSDSRLKKDIKTVTSALDKVDALRGVTFTWKDSNVKAIGLIAQEVKEVLPEIVSTDDDGYMGIRYTNVIGVLVEAIKELKADFEAYKKTHP